MAQITPPVPGGHTSALASIAPRSRSRCQTQPKTPQIGRNWVPSHWRHNCTISSNFCPFRKARRVASHARGRWFKPSRAHHESPVNEHLTAGDALGGLVGESHQRPYGLLVDVPPRCHLLVELSDLVAGAGPVAAFAANRSPGAGRPRGRGVAQAVARPAPDRPRPRGSRSPA